jgi:hypothetical protein
MGQSVSTLAAALFSVFLTSRLTYRRSYSEKVWENRRLAYSYIMSRLSSVKSLCSAMDDAISEDPIRFWEGDQNNWYDERMHKRMHKIRKRFSDDYLMLSDEFIALMESLLSSIAVDRYEVPPEAHDIFCAGLREWEPKLLAQARSEVKGECRKASSHA